MKERAKGGFTPKPGSLTFHGQVIFQCRISYLSILLLMPVGNLNPSDILNKIALLYYFKELSSKPKTCREQYNFIQFSFSKTGNEVLKRWQRRYLVMIFPASHSLGVHVKRSLSRLVDNRLKTPTRT